MVSSSAKAPASAPFTAARRIARLLVPSAIALATSAAACSATDKGAPTPAFREDLAVAFQAKCVECHSGDAPAGGWRATSYMDVIGCVAADGSPATGWTNSPDEAPILKVLSDHTHLRGLPIVKRLNDAEKDQLYHWVAAGAPAWRSAVHDPSFVDPRSPKHHSKWLRARKWQPMLDPSYQPAQSPDADGVVDPGPCGQCHAGLPASATPGASNPDAGPRYFAPGATDCTSCHNKPGGVLGCTTCHGHDDKPYGVRDVCFNPPSQRGPLDATEDRERNHDGHVLAGSQFMSKPLICTACHNVPGGDDILNGLHGGTHANGQIDVVLAPGVAGANASWDPTTKACTNRCHNATPDMKSPTQDAKRPTPSFDDKDKIQCGDCHGAPPSGPGGHDPLTNADYVHYVSPDGTCTFCHKEVLVDATGNKSLKQPVVLHLDGKIEKGDGSGRCDACHGSVGAPDDTLLNAMPHTGSHERHLNPKWTNPIGCENCHVVPTKSSRHPVGDTGHGHVAFSGLATAAGFPAKPYQPGGSCSVYCHSAIPQATDASGAPQGVPNPVWGMGPSGGACGACHGVPPPHHFEAGTCGGIFCHGGIVTPDPTRSLNDAGVVFTDAGVGVHVNGAVNPVLP